MAARGKKILLDGVTATGAGAIFSPPRPKVLAQVEGITTATVALQGSSDGTNWVTLRSVTADEAFTTDDPFEYFRGNVTAYTSGTITMTLSWVGDG